jgi:hypothetical protein
MKKLKKFNELFDSEELRDNPEHEITKISGDYSYLVDPTIPMITFKDDNIVNLLSKVSYARFPFFKAFMNATNEDGGELKFDGFKVGMKYDEEEKYYNLLAFSEEHLLVIGVKILSHDKYDVFIYSDNLNDEEYFKDFEAKEVNINQFFDIIQDVYLPELQEVGFSELTHYNYEDYLSMSN